MSSAALRGKGYVETGIKENWRVVPFCWSIRGRDLVSSGRGCPKRISPSTTIVITGYTIVLVILVITSILLVFLPPLPRPPLRLIRPLGLVHSIIQPCTSPLLLAPRVLASLVAVTLGLQVFSQRLHLSLKASLFEVISEVVVGMHKHSSPKKPIDSLRKNTKRLNL